MRHIPRVFEGTRLYTTNGAFSVHVPLAGGPFNGTYLEVGLWHAEIAGEWWEWEATPPDGRQWHTGVEFMVSGPVRRITADIERAREVAAHA